MSMNLDVGLNINLGASNYFASGGYPPVSPFLPSYQGMSGDALQGTAWLQANYNPDAPLANQVRAADLIQAAQQATDPGLKNSLLQEATRLLTPTGSATPAGGYQPASSAAPATTSPAASGSGDGSSELTVNGNTVDTGRYEITASQDESGKLTIKDKETGDETVIWGDPHVDANGQHVADFQKDNLDIQLQDGTTVHIKPTEQNGNGVSYIDQVAVTKGDDAVTMSGFHDGDLHVSNPMDGEAGYVSGLYDTPETNNITMGDDGNLYYNNADGSMGAEITADNGIANLDDAGGGRVGEPGSGAGGVDPATLQQLEQAVMANSSGMMQQMMLSMLQQMMSQTSYAQA